MSEPEELRPLSGVQIDSIEQALRDVDAIRQELLFKYDVDP